MPIFDFKCNKCDSTFEKLCNVDVESVKCKFCGNDDTVKQLSAPGGFQFNGSGFYETDYKRK